MPNEAAILPQFLTRIGVLGGPATSEEQLTAARAALTALAERLTPAECARLAADLPHEFRACFDCGCETPRVSLAPAPAPEPITRIFSRVSDALGLPLGRAVETVQVVCRVVAETIDETTRAVLTDHPHRELAALFELPDRGASKPPGRARRASSIAEGTAGSRRPVSEAAARPGQAGSVAAWSDARMGRTLGDYHGPGPDTLATGAAGSRRGLSDAV